jgi:hypothetical protein
VIATLLQKQFDTRAALAYITRTDGDDAVAAVVASGFRDDLESTLLPAERRGWVVSVVSAYGLAGREIRVQVASRRGDKLCGALLGSAGRAKAVPNAI